MPEIIKDKKIAAFMKIMESPRFSEDDRFQYRLLTEAEDFNNFLANTACSYITNSCLFENNTFASIVIGARKDGGFRAEVWHYIAGMDYVGTSEILCFKNDLDLDEAIEFADKAPYCFTWQVNWHSYKQKLLEKYAMIPRPGRIFKVTEERQETLPSNDKLHHNDPCLTFGSGENPAKGWAIILFGAPCLEKSHINSNLLSLNAEVINIDELYARYSNLLNTNNDEHEKLDKKINSSGKDNKKLRGHYGIFRESYYNQKFQMLNKNPDCLPNIIVDITGYRDCLIKESADILYAMGYRISFVLALVQPPIALLHNLKLKKMLPCDMLEGVLRQSDAPIIHQMNNIRPEKIDEAWIILSNKMTNSFKQTFPEIAEYVNKNRVMKLEKNSEGLFIIPKQLNDYLIYYSRDFSDYHEPFENAEIISFKNMLELCQIVEGKYGNIEYFEKQFMQGGIHFSFNRILSWFYP